MLPLNEHYWEGRYQNNQTGWDAGAVTTPLKEYFDQLKNKELRILIPGCGNAHEAEYLFHNGFRNVWLVDVAESPLRNFKDRVPGFPQEQLLHHNFFDLPPAYDLIVEQTFFCALEPGLRPAYAKKCFDLLSENGKLVGLLFNDPLGPEGPPFGGNAAEYRSYFEPYFNFIYFEKAYNSIKPRQGRELFICLQKKKNVQE